MLNLFRKDGELVSLCAVPDGGALPHFLHGAGWAFAGKVADIAEQLPAAERATFREVLRETGYYVFVAA
ncbi:hypothetical protein [Aureimonas sp. AU4]|uniref:hypothetical protein n=1 Tax=Aureimonas sp. AU4 TaxID=1638163 RepID=UPI0007812F50|nr:hypothetical protein [Aureimonas sp. AU4]